MHLTKEEQILQKHFQDMLQQSYQKSIPLYSNFCSPADLELAFQVLDGFYDGFAQEGKQYLLYGGYPDAERKIICFLPEQEWQIEKLLFPISCIQIQPVNKRFCDVLTHRDYLGAVMHLRITREQIGDILVKKEGSGTPFYTGYIFCKNDKRKLLTDITQIKHTTVIGAETDFAAVGWQTAYQDITGSVSSFRLDAVIALALRLPRSQVLEIIQERSVFLNGRCCTENAKKLKEGDTFSVRGYGKFIFEKANALSKKGRYHIIVKKYI